MNKKEMVKELSNKTGMTQIKVREFLDIMFDIVAEHYGDEDGVPIVDGLTVITKERSPRTAMNLQTGEKMSVPAKRVVSAKIGKALKQFDAVIE